MGKDKKITIVYVTSSEFKKEEIEVFVNNYCFADGAAVKDYFEFDIRKVPIREMLEVDLEVMVLAEAAKAYGEIRCPCIVEHAGLIFEDYVDESYPGGLTKPMWNTLGLRFLQETNSAGKRALARAVVAYCDGKKTQTFVGETWGKLATEPRGGREFYWDTVFIPDDPSGRANGRTYAEIVEEKSLGLDYKIVELSQSAKAMCEFLEYRRANPIPDLWK